MKYCSFYEIRNRVILAILWSFLLLCFFLFLSPEINLYHQQTIKWHNLQTTYSQQKLRKNFARIKEEKEAKANYLMSLESRLYFEDEFFRLTESFKDISTVSMARLVQFNLGTVNQKGIYPFCPIEIIIQGKYEGIIRFLSVLKQEFYYKNISVIITPHEKEVQCLVKFEIYIKPENWSD